MKSLLVSLLAAVLVGCGVTVDGNVSASSGSMHDQYMEEPIVTGFKQYKPALMLSNKLIELIQKGDYTAVYHEYSSDELKGLVDQASFEKMMESISANAGQIEEFKPMQWYFQKRGVGGRTLLSSTKIVKHKGLMVSYVFTFNQEQYDKIVGFNVSNYKPFNSKSG